MNGTPGLDPDPEHDMGGLATLPGLEAVSEQLAERIAVLRAEQARRQGGTAVTRPAWKNLNLQRCRQFLQGHNAVPDRGGRQNFYVTPRN